MQSKGRSETMNAKNQTPAPTKTRSPEHAGATLAQQLRRKRIALAAAETRVSDLRGDIELLKKTAEPEVLRIAMAIMGEA
jgi:hypothetical protein